MALVRVKKPSAIRRRLAARIRELRQERGLSQEALAAAVGLHRTYVGGIKRAERNVSIDNVERIARGFGCSVCELLGCE